MTAAIGRREDVIGREPEAASAPGGGTAHVRTAVRRTRARGLSGLKSVLVIR